jgi:hypothetical protein
MLSGTAIAGLACLTLGIPSCLARAAPEMWGLPTADRLVGEKGR